MTASQKETSKALKLMALMTALADRAELDKEISAITRSLADAYGIPASYPLQG